MGTSIQPSLSQEHFDSSAKVVDADTHQREKNWEQEVLGHRQVMKRDAQWISRRRALMGMLMNCWATYRESMHRLEKELVHGFQVIRDQVSSKDAWDKIEIDQTILDTEALLTRDLAEAASQEAAMAASQGYDADRSWHARDRYLAHFNRWAGRELHDGPPSAKCRQPPVDPNWSTWNDLQRVQYWLQLGGYTELEQLDGLGWTPFHHAVEALVFWDRAYNVCAGCINRMSIHWLRAKTHSGQPKMRTALHMLANNSDRALRKAFLVRLLCQRMRELQPESFDCDLLDDQGRTPLHLAVGTGQLDVAKVLVSFGASPYAQSSDGRDMIQRCTGSSGSMRRRDFSTAVVLQCSVQSMSVLHTYSTVHIQ